MDIRKGGVFFIVCTVFVVTSCGWTLAREDEIAKEQVEVICFQDGKQTLQIVAQSARRSSEAIIATEVQGAKGADVEVVVGGALCAIVRGKPAPAAPTPKAASATPADAGPSASDAGPTPKR